MDSGALYHKCDFQVHTPRDACWKGQRTATDEDRHAYADLLVSACHSREIDAIAITDHHDLAFVQHIREAAERAQQNGDWPLTVFPGVELTLGVPCQALLILDADFPSDKFDKVLTVLGLEAHDPDADRLPAVEPLGAIQSLEELCQRLDEHLWLYNRYIVFPNVSDGGKHTIVRAKFASKYKNMPCVGGYVDGSVKKLGKGNRRITQGKDPNWGSKRIAVIQTSDSRSYNHKKLGKFPTWIKWTQPTAEALRQACLACESRISIEKPSVPSVAIRRLYVSDSKFLGKIDIDFNTQYNAIIGGRSTGKSTILGYLRWAIGDQSVDGDAYNEAGAPAARLQSLIEATLVPHKAVVEVYFEINGVSHVIRRHASSGDIELKIGDKSFTHVSEKSVVSLLPIHAYAQKQLSSVAVRVEEMRRFVSSPIQSELNKLDEQIAEISGQLRQSYGALQRYRLLKTSIQNSSFRAESSRKQADNLRKPIKVLSEEDQEILDQEPLYDQVSRELDDISQRETAIVATVRALLDELDRDTGSTEVDKDPSEEEKDPSEEGKDPSEIETLLSKVSKPSMAAVQTLHSSISEALTAFVAESDPSKRREEIVKSLRSQISDFESAYEAVKKRSEEDQDRIADLVSLETEIQELDDLIAHQHNELQKLGDPVTELADCRQAMAKLRHQRADLISTQCSKLSKLSEGLIVASLRLGAGFKPVEERFRALIKGSHVRHTKVEALFANLAKESDPIATWEKVIEEIEHLTLVEGDSEITSETCQELNRLGFGPADLKRAAMRLTPGAWLDLALTRIEDHPEFKYRVSKGELIDFLSASAGQQATALLQVLLNQFGMPLLIDQPEDDLDNAVIIDVAKHIWEAKARRQLIFASHSPNLVVNGDAELVLVCENETSGDQSAGIIRHKGAIDVPDVREAITTVMEGGERAFLLRKEKYGF